MSRKKDTEERQGMINWCQEQESIENECSVIAEGVLNQSKLPQQHKKDKFNRLQIVLTLQFNIFENNNLFTPYLLPYFTHVNVFYRYRAIIL